MVRRRLAVAVVGAALVLPAVAACGADEPGPKGSPAGGGPSNAATDAGESKKQQSIDMRRREENMIAACMKKSGFTYIPYVPQDMLNPPAPKPSDYASLKAFRSKYGFGSYFAPLVYPDDPNLAPPAAEEDPNAAILDRLDKAQTEAYLTAYDGYTAKKDGPLRFTAGCVAEAVKAVDPIAFKRAKYRYDLLGRKHPDENSPEFKELCSASASCRNSDGDEARLKPLEVAYTTCLKRQGYPVDYTPDEAVSDTVAVRVDKFDTDPDVFTTKVDPAVARRELKNEIKAALEDLECGKDYIAAKAEMDARNAAESPPSGGLP